MNESQSVIQALNTIMHCQLGSCGGEYSNSASRKPVVLSPCGHTLHMSCSTGSQCPVDDCNKPIQSRTKDRKIHEVLQLLQSVRGAPDASNGEEGVLDEEGAQPNQCKSFQIHDTQGREGISAKTSPMGITDDAKSNGSALAEAPFNELAEHHSGGAPDVEIPKITEPFIPEWERDLPPEKRLVHFANECPAFCLGHFIAYFRLRRYEIKTADALLSYLGRTTRDKLHQLKQYQGPDLLQEIIGIKVKNPVTSLSLSDQKIIFHNKAIIPALYFLLYEACRVKESLEQIRDPLYPKDSAMDVLIRKALDSHTVGCFLKQIKPGSFMLYQKSLGQIEPEEGISDIYPNLEIDTELVGLGVMNKTFGEVLQMKPNSGINNKLINLVEELKCRMKKAWVGTALESVRIVFFPQLGEIEKITSSHQIWDRIIDSDMTLGDFFEVCKKLKPLFNFLLLPVTSMFRCDRRLPKNLDDIPLYEFIRVGPKTRRPEFRDSLNEFCDGFCFNKENIERIEQRLNLQCKSTLGLEVINEIAGCQCITIGAMLKVFGENCTTKEQTKALNKLRSDLQAQLDLYHNLRAASWTRMQPR